MHFLFVQRRGHPLQSASVSGSWAGRRRSKTVTGRAYTYRAGCGAEPFTYAASWSASALGSRYASYGGGLLHSSRASRSNNNR